ncbi:hypothetical protein BCR32DRAFT_283691 [Anaeromyces robustus]|uniref:Uncharacterized protein n=1 Tax=Anaeromyces robustus TaxID=1754192 RepID=A0A1Y1WUW6_9FUNG|nr:hypothetical protein BCR32DRAFT_283691 [Anaeromyces robustus]|eukprot:ORX76924.1 hypothetical protein BCR32DRAFT_283691 [Anaeromyces robustus]
MRSNISPTSGPNGLKFRYVVALEQSFSMSIKSSGNLQYLPSYQKQAIPPQENGSRSAATLANKELQSPKAVGWSRRKVLIEIPSALIFKSTSYLRIDPRW